jgi:hypothetical protein
MSSGLIAQHNRHVSKVPINGSDKPYSITSFARARRDAGISIPTLDDDSGTLGPAEPTKLVDKSVVEADVAQGVAQHSDPRHFPRRLGCGCRREDEQHNQKTGTAAANRFIRSPCLRTGRLRDREAERLGPETPNL